MNSYVEDLVLKRIEVVKAGLEAKEEITRTYRDRLHRNETERLLLEKELRELEYSLKRKEETE